MNRIDAAEAGAVRANFAGDCCTILLQAACRESFGWGAPEDRRFRFKGVPEALLCLG